MGGLVLRQAHRDPPPPPVAKQRSEGSQSFATLLLCLQWERSHGLCVFRMYIWASKSLSWVHLLPTLTLAVLTVQMLG